MTLMISLSFLLTTSPVEAKRLYSEGAAAYAIGHFDQALADFEKAYEADRAPAVSLPSQRMASN